MGGGSGIGTGAPVSPLTPVRGPLQTIEPCKPSLGRHRSYNNTEERPHYPPLGLQNVGNSCYANAALQCLLNTALSHALLDPTSNQIFRRYSSNPDLLSLGSGSVDSDEEEEDGYESDASQKKEDKEARRKNREARRKTREKLQSQEKCQWLTGALTDITRIYTAGSELFDDNNSKSSWQSLLHLFSVSNNNRIVDPSSVTRHVNKLSPCLRPYQQEDAHEFIRTLISTLTLEGHNKQLSSLMDGLLESAVTCQTCRHTSITRDRYMDLSLDIQGSDVQDLVGALRRFTKTELLDSANKVICSRCDTKQIVSKGLRLATAPSILVCHLKRFAFDIYGRSIRLAKKVSYPLRLEIGDFMSRANQGRPAPYELVGVVVHAGKSCNWGHYYSYVKSGDHWYKANDEVVTKVDVDVVLNQQAYILIYEIEGMRASHGFYGCGKYHLTRSRSSKKRPEDLDTVKSDAESPPECTSPTCDDKEKSSPSKLLNILDSLLDFCGSTSTAEAVRDAMCDSGKKEKKKKKKKKKHNESPPRYNSLRKAGPIVSSTSSESNFSRITPSDDGSSRHSKSDYLLRKHRAITPLTDRITTSSKSTFSHITSSDDGSSRQSKSEYLFSKHRAITPLTDRIRSSSDSKTHLQQRSPTRDIFRRSGSMTDENSSQGEISTLIKSCSSNNLQEKEQEAAHGYENESYPIFPSTYGTDIPTNLLSPITLRSPTRKEDELQSDPGINYTVITSRRKATSAPRASKTVSPTRYKNEKRIDLPPLPTVKRNV